MAIAGGAETHVMCSSASGWVDGARIWHVDHSADRAENDLRVEGTPPSEIESLREEALSKQAAESRRRNGAKDSYLQVDYIFNVPIDLCWQLTGFHYDRGSPNEDWHFVAPIHRPFLLTRLFGG
jgi:hypothetical protein